MLHLIDQNNFQKIATENYVVSIQQDPRTKKDFHTIVATDTNGKANIVATYGDLQDAVKVFWGMVAYESRQVVCFLPADDKKAIKKFVKEATQEDPTNPVNESGISFGAKSGGDR